MQNNATETRKRHYIGFRCDYSLYASAIDYASKLGVSISELLTRALSNMLDKNDETFLHTMPSSEQIPLLQKSEKAVNKRKDKITTCKELFSEENEILLNKLLIQYP